MTKRALSLLLALIMALSLCVPAFAAEGDEAEPVAAEEVSEPEAAPAAEEEEVEPEAEEVQGEIMTLAAEGIETIAAATPAELEKLHQELDAAEAIEADVRAGKWYGSAYTYEMWLAGAADPQVENFLKTLSDAKTMYADALKGYYESKAALDEMGTKLYNSWYNVITTNVWSGGCGDSFLAPLTLTYERFKGIAAQGDVLAADMYQAGWYKKAVELYKEIVAADDGTWTYAEVTSILAKAFKGEKLYNAFEGWWHASGDTLEAGLVPGTATKPVWADKVALEEAIAALEAALKTDHVMQEADENAAKGHIVSAKEYFDLQQANGLKANVTLWDVNRKISWLEAYTDLLVPNVRGARFVSYVVNPKHDTVYAYVERNNAVTDTHEYKVTVAYNGGKEFEISYTSAGNDDATHPGVTRYKYAATSGTVNGKVPGYQTGDILTFRLYDNKSGTLVDTLEIKLDFSYIGPEIVSQSYNKGANNFSVTLNSAPANFAGFDVVKLVVTRPDGSTKTVAYGNKEGSVVKTWTDAPVQVGTYSVVLYVSTADGNGAVTQPRPAVEFEVKSIESYVKVATSVVTSAHPYGTAGYDCLLKAIAGAEGYESMVAKVGSTADAKQVVANNLAVANKIVAAAAKTPDTTANEQAVNAALANLTTALSNLAKPGDQSDLDAAIAEAAALVKSDYTAASWNALQSAVAAGKQAKLDHDTTSEADTKAIAAAAKAIRDAIAALKVVKPDTSELEALIKSVPGKLAADNYTAESKAAVQTALAAAQAAMLKDGVKQSEIDKATKDLQTALNALAVESGPIGPQPPASGTGWIRYDNDWYYFENGTMQYSEWVYMKGSGLWYYVGADGKMLTGFQYVENNWYFFRTGGDTVGSVQSGWVLLGKTTSGKDNWGWFTTSHKGNFGKCTYTTQWGDIKIS